MVQAMRNGWRVVRVVCPSHQCVHCRRTAAADPARPGRTGRHTAIGILRRSVETSLQNESCLPRHRSGPPDGCRGILRNRSPCDDGSFNDGWEPSEGKWRVEFDEAWAKEGAKTPEQDEAAAAAAAGQDGAAGQDAAAA